MSTPRKRPDNTFDRRYTVFSKIKERRRAPLKKKDFQMSSQPISFPLRCAAKRRGKPAPNGWTGWYGINFDRMPELHWRYGYSAVILIAGTVILFEIFYFKKKGML